jgi:hypothetical protein
MEMNAGEMLFRIGTSKAQPTRTIAPSAPDMAAADRVTIVGQRGVAQSAGMVYSNPAPAGSPRPERRRARSHSDRCNRQNTASRSARAAADRCAFVAAHFHKRIIEFLPTPEDGQDCPVSPPGARRYRLVAS